MIGTEVIDTTHHTHASRQGLRLTGQGPGSTNQRGQSLPKGRIEPFNKSGVNVALTLRGVNEPRNHLTTALHNSSVDRQLPGSTLFDHLHNGYLRPGSPAAASPLTKAGLAHPGKKQNQ
jgi:hypothetical protein